MNINNDDIISESIPCFFEKTEYLYNNLKDYSYDDLKKLLACNDVDWPPESPDNQYHLNK